MKSKKRERELHSKADELFSTKEMVLFCIDKCKKHAWLEKDHCILEPSSGDGIFWKHLQFEVQEMVCLDVEPRHPECIKQDFLTYDHQKQFDMVIGNPPFGRRNQLAVKFLNKACLMTNRCVFILPLSFLRPATLDLIDRRLWLVEFFALPSLLFRMPDSEKTKKVGCGLFMFEKKQVLRPLFKDIVDIKQEPHTVPSIETAEYALIHSGASTGKVVDPGTYSKGTTYLLKGKRDIVQETDWSILAKNGGAGQLSLCLTDIHLAIKMMEMGLDYRTGAFGYLKHIELL